MNGFKKVVLFLKVAVCLSAQRTFRNVIHDIAVKYDSLVNSKFIDLKNFQ